MKTIILYCATFLAALGLVGCYRDIGNYNYHSVNAVSFKNLDTINGYSAFFGDTLKIAPAIVSTQNVDTTNAYTYEWSFRIGVAQVAAGSPPNPLRDTVVSTQKNLSTKILFTPGNYSLQYRVTDKASGVVYQTRTNLLVTTSVYEGFLFMNDVNGNARLDMQSYNSTLNTFTQYTDILAKLGSIVPVAGTPYQLLCMNYVGSNISPQNYGIFLLTSGGTNRINQETFQWIPTYNIRYLMLGNVPSSFAAKSITGQYNNTNSSPTFFMYGNDGNMYSYATNAGNAFKYTPLNVYKVGGTPFSTTPYVATDGNAAVFYDADNRKFVSITSPSANVMSDINPLLNFPKGYDLQWMNCNYYPESGQVKKTYAVLKDPSSAKLYLFRFKLGAAVTDSSLTYFKEFKSDIYNSSDKVDLTNATNFTVSPNFEYLFYSVGGKVYEYDLGLSTNFLMQDYGSSVVSYLSFLHIYDRYGLAQNKLNNNYVIWSTALSVGTYDPTQTAGSNGTYDQYTVTPVNGPLQRTIHWTGFGKIVSVAYRSR